MAQNRRRAKYVARVTSNASQIVYSRYMNALAEYVRDNANADHIETEQDLDMLINGYGAIGTDISYTEGNATTDPNGEILMERLDPLTIGWDLSAKQKNLIDARYAYYYKDYPLEDALDLLSGSKEEDFDVIGQDVQAGFEFNPNGGKYDKIRADGVEFAGVEKNKIARVYNYQWLEYENFYRADNPVNFAQDEFAQQAIMAQLEAIAAEIKETEYQDMFDFDPSKPILTFDQAVKVKLEAVFGELIKPVKFKRKCYYTAILSGNKVFKTYKSLCQQGFTIKFKTGTYDAHNRVWVGMVNSMMEPAKYYNKALTELMFTIASNSKGGVMVEESAVADIKDFSTKWAKTNAVITVRDGALASGRIQAKATPQVPTGLESVVQLSDAAVVDSSGVDRSFMGSRESAQESGLMYKRRIRQVVSSLGRYFDSITMYQKEQARMLADFIRVWVEDNDGSMFRITGEDGADEFAQVSADSLAPEYDVTIQEAMQTTEEKEETAQTLAAFGDKMAAIGDVETAKQFYAEGLQFMNLDGDVRNRLSRVLQPKEQGIDPMQVQQMQMQLELLQAQLGEMQQAKMAADTELKLAQAEKTRADTAKTYESAKQVAIENDLAADAENVTVSI
jgi:hypothetical protein